jgi:sulfite reductase alpha subunit-like flavoprotein
MEESGGVVYVSLSDTSAAQDVHAALVEVVGERGTENV